MQRRWWVHDERYNLQLEHAKEEKPPNKVERGRCLGGNVRPDFGGQTLQAYLLGAFFLTILNFGICLICN